MSNQFIVLGDVSLDCGFLSMRPAAADEFAARVGKAPRHECNFVAIPGAGWRIDQYVSHHPLVNWKAISVPSRSDSVPLLKNEMCPARHFMNIDSFDVEMKWVSAAGKWMATGDKTYRIGQSIGQQTAGEKFMNQIQTLLSLREIEFAESVTGSQSIVVICDRGLGFRSAVATRSGFAQHLMEFLQRVTDTNTGDYPAIVLETTDPLDKHQGQLLDCIRKAGLMSRTVIVVSANGLKTSGIEIRDNLSLESAVADFAQAVVLSRSEPSGSPPTEPRNDEAPLLKRFSGALRVVVRFGTRAALIWNPAGDPEGESAGANEVETELVFGRSAYDPTSSNESSEIGSMFGYSSIVASEIALGFAYQLEQEGSTAGDLSDSIPVSCGFGLSMCETHFEQGFGNDPADIADANRQMERLRSMLKTQHDMNGHVQSSYAMLKPAPNVNQLNSFTILGQPRMTLERTSIVDEELPVKLVRDGFDTLHEHLLPYVKHLKLRTADRKEIEDYAGVANLITKYLDYPAWTRPLCLAVFGPPGCVKSFGITQVTRGITAMKPHTETTQMTFNLSQLSGVEELAAAFHQVRNEGLAGRIPLVFLDEFDSSLNGVEYGWLKYLLAPMQDGQFVDGDRLYHLPRAILVFVGSLNASFKQLEARFRSQAFIDAKGKDFVSRLRHFLEIKGPDHGTLAGKGGSDTARRLRRALLLRSALELKLPEIFDDLEGPPTIRRANIDQAVVRAFLDVSSYKHGVRSLEAIVDMSRASVSRRSFQKASLPPREQLDMHVDSRDFLALVNS